MKILVVGRGGREHALVWKLAQSPQVEQVFCAPGNAGTALDGGNVEIDENDFGRLISFAKENGVDLTVVGPEVPLVGGIVDEFEKAGLKIFGPNAKAAQLEGSKAFAKRLMRKANVPTAEYAEFTSLEGALEYLVEREEESFVIKADGLAAGKGVTVCRSIEEAEAAVREAMQQRVFGDAGSRIIIEECLTGQEASILALVDGRTILPLEAAQDHKSAHDGDQGPNTGGMGAYSPTPLVNDKLMGQVIETILIPTVHQLRKDGIAFKGVLYAGLMLTSQGPKVLEFNCRFGDPETQPILMRLKTDLAEVLNATVNGKLGKLPALEWDPRPSVCVVMASEGYPGKYEKGREIRGLSEANAIEGAKVFHAGTKLVGDSTVTDGGRVLGVTALGENLPNAKKTAYQAVKQIRWSGAWCRKDISDKARSMET